MVKFIQGDKERLVDVNLDARVENPLGDHRAVASYHLTALLSL